MTSLSGAPPQTPGFIAFGPEYYLAVGGGDRRLRVFRLLSRRSGRFPALPCPPLRCSYCTQMLDRTKGRRLRQRPAVQIELGRKLSNEWGPPHTAPRSLLRFTFRKRAAACARESAMAPWAHCSAFCQDVPREVKPIVHSRGKTIG